MQPIGRTGQSNLGKGFSHLSNFTNLKASAASNHLMPNLSSYVSITHRLHSVVCQFTHRVVSLCQDLVSLITKMSRSLITYHLSQNRSSAAFRSLSIPKVRRPGTQNGLPAFRSCLFSNHKKQLLYCHFCFIKKPQGRRMHLRVWSFVTGKPTTALRTHDTGLRSEERRMD